MTRQRLLEVEYNDQDGEKEVVVHFRPFLLKRSPRMGAGHLRNANREFLLAIRSVVDEAIQWLGPSEASAPGGGRPRRQRVKVTEEKAGGA